ncbi:MAG: alpha/beta hydrolase [Acidimicrobiia bacterium]|nr:alpha/beta hydrolase [Acidimicrobiia bacterium]
MSAATIVLIHGAWLSPASWDRFAQRFEASGYRCLVPAWPFEDRSPEDLRTTPLPQLASVGVKEIVDHLAAQIAPLSDVVLVGHSFGGLFVQQLLDRGLGRAAVAIHPAPGRGVFPDPAAFKASQGVLKVWSFWKKVLTMSRNDFDRFFANGLPDEQRAVEYETQVVPTPGRIFFQAATAPFHRATEVRYDNPTRSPLLLISGSEDRTVPAALVKKTHLRHQGSPAVTELVEFPGRSHYTIREPGWEQVADRAREFWERVI